MGQYFIIVNLDKKEYIVPPLMKIHEICTNNVCRVLPYLLADEEKDGTPLIISIPKDAEVPEGWRKIGEACDGKYVIIEKVTKYYGRWAGDRIIVAGDYGHSGVWDAVMRSKKYKDITKEVFEEFREFLKIIGREDLDPEKVECGFPDLVITDKGIFRDPCIRSH